MSQEGERIRTLEVEIQHIKNEQSDMKEAVKELQKTVWKATGALTALVMIIEVLHLVHK